MITSVLSTVYQQRGRSAVSTGSIMLRPCRTTPCIVVTRTPTIVVFYHPPTIVAVAVAVTVTFISNFPHTIIKLIKPQDCNASSPNHCSSGRRCNRHLLSAFSPHTIIKLIKPLEGEDGAPHR